MNLENFQLNELFINYYKKILIPSQMNENEFNLMLNYFDQPLPIVFRIPKNISCNEKINKKINEIFKNLQNLNFDLNQIFGLPLEFGNVFQINIPLNIFRKDINTQILRNWLISSNQQGYIQRQELVSMIPHHFLNIQPNSSVIDLCSSPGSKTIQIAESLNPNEGFIIANDSDLSRCFTLVHQLKRIGMRNIIVTNFNAQSIIDFGFQFDRVLCDVPCSGDGTLRKSPNLKSEWKLSRGSAFHGLQRSILRRGLELLKPNGICVYSTCSLNPLENEAVINSVLLEIGSNIEILDVSNLFPEIKRHSGLTNWSVCDIINNEIIEFQSVNEIPLKSKPKVCKTMFPSNINIGLEKCMRFYPHDINSGGFFVCVLKKINNFPLKELKYPIYKPIGEAPYLPLISNSIQYFNEINEIFQFNNDFPLNQLFIRQEINVKHIYFCSNNISNLINNLGCEKLRIISTGSLFCTKKIPKKILTFYPDKESSDIFLKYSNNQLFKLNPKNMYNLLKSGHKGLKFEDFDIEYQNQFQNLLKCGCLVYIPNTNYIYGGLVFEKSIIIYIRKDLIDFELQKLKFEFNL